MDGVTFTVWLFVFVSVLVYVLQGNEKAYDTIKGLSKKEHTVSPFAVKKMARPEMLSTKLSLSLVDPIFTAWIRRNILFIALRIKSVVTPLTLVVGVILLFCYFIRGAVSWIDYLLPYLQMALNTIGSLLMILIALLRRLSVIWGR